VLHCVPLQAAEAGDRCHADQLWAELRGRDDVRPNIITLNWLLRWVQCTHVKSHQTVNSLLGLGQVSTNVTSAVFLVTLPPLYPLYHEEMMLVTSSTLQLRGQCC
jgi:hypothetical protein